jgi:DNA-binding transcriptional ArsR family regulator
MVNYEKQARIFKVLSGDTRIRMLELLKGGPLCVNALAKRLGVTPSAVSQNLRILRDADLVVADKQGYFVHYGINRQTMTELRSLANGVFSMPNLL